MAKFSFCPMIDSLSNCLLSSLHPSGLLYPRTMDVWMGQEGLGISEGVALMHNCPKVVKIDVEHLSLPRSSSL